MLEVKKLISLKKGAVTLVRGDTAVLNVALHDNTLDKDYEMNEGDKLVFTVREDAGDTGAPLLQIESSQPRIFFKHEDTKDLEAGRYVYDICLFTSLGMVQTIGPAAFILKQDVNHD